MFHPKTFGGIVRPVLLLHFLLGVGSPAYLTKHKVKKSMEIAYTVWSITLFHLMLYYSYTCTEYYTSSKLVLTSTYSYIWFWMSYMTMVVVIIAPRFSKENVNNMISATEEIDQKMDTIGLPKQHRLQCKYQIRYFFWWLLHILILIELQWHFLFEPSTPIYKKIILCLIGNALPILTLTTHLSFCFWIRYIRTKFSQLNCLMEEMIDSSGPKRFLEISDCQMKSSRCLNIRLLKGNVQIITKAKECHLDLIKIARRVNKFYGVHLLSTLVISILTIIGMLYVINSYVWYAMSRIDLFVVIPLVSWIVLNSTKMIHLYINCMQTTDEAAKAGYLLCRLYDSSTSMKFRMEVQHFAQQVLQNPLVMNICGLVDIDETFLTSTVGWIFTYIIVILQLQTQSFQQKLNANSTFVTLAKNYTN